MWQLHRFRLALSALALAVFAAPAHAHPHVWVTMQSELVYAADGSASAVRHAWTFDDMYSTMATMGLAAKEKGKFTREELAGLATVNIESLKDYDYFTFARADGKPVEFAAPAPGYYLEFKDGLLTLHLTLPFKAPVKAQSLDVEVYDNSYFVNFSFAQKDPVALVGAPANCKLATAQPGDAAPTPAKPLSESFFNNPTLSQNYGARFASRIAVKCP